LLLLLFLVAFARADGFDETEHRLKKAGVDAPLREEIHRAIRDAVHRVRARQDRFGRVAPDHTESQGTGEIALVALAFRHAAIPDAVAGVPPAIRYLLEHRSRTCLDRTYEAGITAMLLATDRSQPRFLGKLHAKLSRGPQTGSGYWSYGTSSTEGSANLSTAQFGALGLWAAERRGQEVAERAWRLHLETLLRAQEVDGSWAYIPPWRNVDW
jgi:hypothetical protein